MTLQGGPSGGPPFPTKAMILAAGRGTRLRPLTDRVPKCMVRVGGKPILESSIEWLRRHGVTDLIINLHRMPDMVMDHFGDGERWGVKITYSMEPEPLGTAGGVKNVGWFFDGPFFVWYGDNLSTCDLDRLYAFHRVKEAMATLALHYREDPTASGITGLDGEDRITRFLEKPRPDQVFSHWVSTGIFVMEPAALEMIPGEGRPDFGRDLFPKFAARGVPLYGYKMSGNENLWWIDRPADLARVRDLLGAEQDDDPRVQSARAGAHHP